MHEVNNPLEAITNLAYLLQHEPMTATAQEHLALLQEQITVLTGVTRPSLTFHRDKKVSKLSDLPLLIGSVNKLHAGRLQAAGIQLHCHCPKKVRCDVVSSELLQVLSNLVLNAPEALSEGKQGAHIHIRVRCCPGCIHIVVAANGPGIPYHLEDKLFEAHAPGKPQGAGLGLWISERIISNHWGSIRYRTSRKPGRTGTVFRIYLPCEATSLRS